MRTVIVALSGLVVISSIVSVKLWGDLRTERQMTADLQTRLTEAESKLTQAAASARSPVVELPPVVTAAAAPASRSDPPPAIAPRPFQPPASMNRGRDMPLTGDEPKPERVVVDTGFAVNQTGQVRAKPSAIMTSNDLNKDGVVTKEEATTAGKALIRLWNAYDLNKDGVVDDAEITRASGL